MQIALEDLKLERLAVVYPGARHYTLSDRVTVLPLAAIAKHGVDALFPPRKRR